MRAELFRQQDDTQLYRMNVTERPHLVAESAVFVAEPCLLKQREIIDPPHRIP